MGKNNEGQNGTDDLESLITSELVSNYIQNKITKIHLGKQLAKNVLPSDLFRVSFSKFPFTIKRNLTNNTLQIMMK